MKASISMYLLATILAVNPPYNFEKKEIIRKQWFKLYCSLHALLIITLQINSLCNFVYGHHAILMIAELELAVVKNLVVTVQSITSLLTMVIYINNWEKLYNFNENLKLILHKNKYLINNKTIHIILSVSTLMFFAAIIVYNIIWAQIISYKKQAVRYLPTYYLIFAEHVRMTNSYIFLESIKDHFRFFNKKVKQDYHLGLTVIRLKHIEILYRKICSIINFFNSAAGIQILLGILQSSIVSFSYLSYAYTQLLHPDIQPTIALFSSLMVAIFALVNLY